MSPFVLAPADDPGADGPYRAFGAYQLSSGLNQQAPPGPSAGGQVQVSRIRFSLAPAPTGNPKAAAGPGRSGSAYRPRRSGRTAAPAARPPATPTGPRAPPGRPPDP